MEEHSKSFDSNREDNYPKRDHLKIAKEEERRDVHIDIDDDTEEDTEVDEKSDYYVQDDEYERRKAKRVRYMKKEEERRH